MKTGWHTDDTIIVIDTLFGYICYGINYKQIFAVALSFWSRGSHLRGQHHHYYFQHEILHHVVKTLQV